MCLATFHTHAAPLLSLPDFAASASINVIHLGAGIRKWPKEYLPSIFDEQRVDQIMEISQSEAEETMRSLARVEGKGLVLTVDVPDYFEVTSAPVMSTSINNTNCIAAISHQSS